MHKAPAALSLAVPLLPARVAQVVARSAEETAEDTKHATKRGVRGALEGVKDAVYSAGSALRSGECKCLLPTYAHVASSGLTPC